MGVKLEVKWARSSQTPNDYVERLCASFGRVALVESEEKTLAPRRQICISARSATCYLAGMRPTWTTSRFGRFGNDEAGFGRPQI
jgi:hypothetical protein